MIRGVKYISLAETTGYGTSALDFVRALSRAGIAVSWHPKVMTPSGYRVATTFDPVAAAAGLKSLEILRRDGQYPRLRDLGDRVAGMIRKALEPTGLPYRIVGDATLFEVVFTAQDPLDYRAVQGADAARAKLWNDTLRANGIFKSPGKTYPSLALTEADFEWTDHAIAKAADAVVAE